MKFGTTEPYKTTVPERIGFSEKGAKSLFWDALPDRINQGSVLSLACQEHHRRQQPEAVAEGDSILHRSRDMMLKKSQLSWEVTVADVTSAFLQIEP